MTPLEFAAHRHLIGYSQRALATYLSWTGHTATVEIVERWEEGADPIPEAVAATMRDLARVHREFANDHAAPLVKLPRAAGTVALAASILDRHPDARLDWV